MGYQDFISEIEASSLAGVSVKTLTRFADAGYLQIENDSDGLRLFEKNEVLDLFGIQNNNRSEEFSKPAKEQPSPGVRVEKIVTAKPSYPQKTRTQQKR